MCPGCGQREGEGHHLAALSCWDLEPDSPPGGGCATLSTPLILSESISMLNTVSLAPPSWGCEEGGWSYVSD